MSETFHHICPNATWCSRTLLDSLLELAVEIAREGREGRRVGTLFTIGFADIVLQNSRPLILDPLAAHPRHARHITDPNLRGTIKELAQLDGAFILDDTGTVLAACRYLDTSSKAVEMAFGLGSRHLAAASISKGNECDRHRGLRKRGRSRLLRRTHAGRNPTGIVAIKQTQPASARTDSTARFARSTGVYHRRNPERGTKQLRCAFPATSGRRFRTNGGTVCDNYAIGFDTRVVNHSKLMISTRMPRERTSSTNTRTTSPFHSASIKPRAGASTTMVSSAPLGNANRRSADSLRTARIG